MLSRIFFCQNSASNCGKKFASESDSGCSFMNRKTVSSICSQSWWAPVNLRTCAHQATCSTWVKWECKGSSHLQDWLPDGQTDRGMIAVCGEKCTSGVVCVRQWEHKMGSIYISLQEVNLKLTPPKWIILHYTEKEGIRRHKRLKRWSWKKIIKTKCDWSGSL